MAKARAAADAAMEPLDPANEFAAGEDDGAAAGEAGEPADASNNKNNNNNNSNEEQVEDDTAPSETCLLYTSPSPRDRG